MSLASAESSPQVAEVASLTVIGYTVRTNNAQEMSGNAGQIGPLWGRFMHGGADAIPGVVDPGMIYAAYTHYESDETGAYDVILGKSVQPGQQAPAGMRSLPIPAAQYLVFRATANSPEAIKAAWLGVYEYFGQHKEQRRAFSIDFEQYSGAGVKIFIAVQ